MEAPISERELILSAKIQAQACLIMQLLEVLSRAGIVPPTFFDRLDEVWGRMEERPEGWPTSLGWNDGLRAKVTDETRKAGKAIIAAARQAATS